MTAQTFQRVGHLVLILSLLVPLVVAARRAWAVHVVLVDYVRLLRTRSYLGEVQSAMSGVYEQCGCVPLAEGAEVPLGVSCNQPGQLVTALQIDRHLDAPLVCDAFGYPMFVRGVAASELTYLGIDVPSCRPPSGHCDERYGHEWSPDVDVISVGSDGLRTALDTGNATRLIIDSREDFVDGSRTDQRVSHPPPAGPWGFYWQHGRWLDRSGQRIASIDGTPRIRRVIAP